VRTAISQLQETLGRELTDLERRGLIVGLQTANPLETAVTLPWLRSFIREEAWSVGILTALNIYRRVQAGTLSETTDQVIADAGMDAVLMFFIAMRSPSRVDAISRVRSQDLLPSNKTVFVAHPNARSATMLAPVVAISSLVGAGIGQLTDVSSDNPIDTPEEWMAFLRQTRNRMIFDIGHVALFSPLRSAIREEVYSDFSDTTLLGSLIVNGYCAFDFGALAYPLYLGARDAMQLDHLPESVRTLITQGDGKVFLSIRAPGTPDPERALLPTVNSVMAQFMPL
jgi:hypothetical protein